MEARETSIAPEGSVSSDAGVTLVFELHGSVEYIIKDGL